MIITLNVVSSVSGNFIEMLREELTAFFGTISWYEYPRGVLTIVGVGIRLFLALEVALGLHG